MCWTTKNKSMQKFLINYELITGDENGKVTIWKLKKGT